jgi:hypothetical protein
MKVFFGDVNFVEGWRFVEKLLDLKGIGILIEGFVEVSVLRIVWRKLGFGLGQCRF